MNFTSLLMALAPLVIFVIIDAYASARTALLSAMGLSVLLLVYYYFALGGIDATMVLESGLIVLLGLIALKMNNPLFFKFQPVAVGICLGLFLAWFQFFDEPYLLKILPRMGKLVPEAAPLIGNPAIVLIMKRLSWQMILLFWVHAGLVAYSALKMRDLGWILMRLAIYPLLMVMMIANMLVLGLVGV